MLGEIARPPTNELLGCRESYSVAAGIALGLVSLGRGSDPGLADLFIEDKLGSYMHGRAPVYSSPDGGDGMARHYPTPLALRAWGRRAPRPLARPSHEASSPQAKEPTASLATRCYRIREGPRVNVDVTAAGATLALGLLFCKSNNASVAAQLEACPPTPEIHARARTHTHARTHAPAGAPSAPAGAPSSGAEKPPPRPTHPHPLPTRVQVPHTVHALRCVRPDLVLLRVLARGLILWDSVRPTDAWVNSQLTPSTGGGERGGLEPDSTTLRLARLNSLAGACLVLGLRFAGSCNQAAHDVLHAKERRFHINAQPRARNRRFHAPSRPHLGHASAAPRPHLGRTSAAPRPKVHHFYALRLALGGAAASTEGTRADRPTVESCLGTAALAMACVMAGSGHLGSLRLLRVLRRCADNDVSYGFHMSISMAIGRAAWRGAALAGLAPQRRECARLRPVGSSSSAAGGSPSARARRRSPPS